MLHHLDPSVMVPWACCCPGHAMGVGQLLSLRWERRGERWAAGTLCPIWDCDEDATCDLPILAVLFYQDMLDGEEDVD